MTSFLPLVQSVPVAASVWENVYMEESNMRKARTPVINSQVVKTDFNSKSFQGRSQIQVELPLGPLLSHSMICLKIAKSAVPDGAYLRQGWGYRCIRNYEIRTGGQTNLRIYGRQLQLKAISDCETKEKRDAMLELGGSQYKGKNSNVVGDFLTAYVHIYLPFSNLSAGRYLPYDSGILNKPMTLHFEFENARNVFSYTKGDAAAVEAALPTQFAENYFMVQTALMALGPGESIRPEVGPSAGGRGGGSQYNYGWIYPSEFTSTEFTGRPKSGGSLASVRLESFPNGSLQSIDLCLERMTLGLLPPLEDVRISDCPNNEIVYEDMSNIELRYGSQVIYRSDDESNKLMVLSEYTTANQFAVSFPNMSDQAITPGSEIAVNSGTATWVHIQLSQYNECNGLFKNLVQDGVSALGSMMSIVFNTPELYELSNGATTGQPVSLGETKGDNKIPQIQPQYRLHATYNYQVSLNTWEGHTDQIFLPSNASGPYTMAS